MNRLLLALFAALPVLAHAQPDLQRCVFPTGIRIEEKLCDHLRQVEAKERLAKEEDRALTAERMRRNDAEKQALQDAEKHHAARAVVLQQQEAAHQAAAASAAAADLAAQRQAIAQRRDLDDQQRAQAAQLVAEAARDQEAAEAAQEAREAKARKACGASYGKPAVGMTLQRARQCVGDFTLYAADGPRKVYQAGRLHVTVVAGRIQRWIVF